MCGLRLLNEEAAEPFLLLSNYMPLCLRLREGERERVRGIKCSFRILSAPSLPSLAFPLLLEHLMLGACVHLSWGGPGEDTQWNGEPVATGPLYC